MKKNILIIGFGDLAERFERLVPNNSHTILGLTRSPNNHKGKNLTEWDWDKGQEFQLSIKHFDTVIFFPKPAEFSEEGYRSGFIESLKLIHKSLSAIEYKSFIAISSTRVYGASHNALLSESLIPEPSDYRGSIVLEYEALVKSFFKDKSLILRSSGLHTNSVKWMHNFIDNFDGIKKQLPNFYLNRLHRNEFAKIISYAIENDLYLHHAVINCSEGMVSYKDIFKDEFDNLNFDDYFDCQNKDKREVSNMKLKEVGFKFKS